jgi:glutathione peroxidase
VNGALESPLYTWLKAHDPESKKDIDWNFEKFLVDQKGQVIKRYSYNIEPSQIESDIIKLLQLN